MKCLRLFPVLWCLIGLHEAALAQVHGVTYLTPGDGLSQGYIADLLQDREGFVWAATKNGLNRYDGYRFEVFTNDPYNERSLSDDFLNAIVEYGNFLVIPTKGSALNVFDKRTRDVFRIPVQFMVPSFAPEEINTTCAFVDADGNLWVQLIIEKRLDNIFKIEMPGDFWQNPRKLDPGELKFQTWPVEVSGAIHMSADGKYLYTGSKDGIFQIATHTNTWSEIGSLDNIEAFFKSGPDGRLWVTVYPASGPVLLYHIRPGIDPDLIPAPVRDEVGLLLFVSKDHIWLQGGKSIGVFRLNADGSFNPDQPEIPLIDITAGHYCAMVDRSGISWIGTNGLGIMKINLRSRQFRHLFQGQSVMTPVFQDKSGTILAHNNQLSRFLSQPPGVGSPVYLPALNDLYAFQRFQVDALGNYWIMGVYNSQIGVLKKVTLSGQTEVYPLPMSVPAFERFDMQLDAEQTPWIAAENALLHFDPSAKRFEVFDYQKVWSSNSGCLAMARTADGSWWIGKQNGLVRAKPASGTFEFSVFRNDLSKPNSLRNNSVACLLTDPFQPDILWIGTKGGGLNRLDTRNLSFSHLTTREGFPNDVIYGILPETTATGGLSLWMSSNKGLIRYTPATGVIKNFTKEDGVQDDEFNTLAFGKAADGSLMFGGVNGLTVFRPDMLKNDTLAPRTLISGLIVNDRDVSWHDSTGVLRQGIEFSEAITLPYSRNSLSFEFVALNFSSPDKNRFRYYLEGAEKEWAHESSDHKASYLNLSPGTYVFRVLGSNSEGIWSTKAASLQITILPPWYRTWLAYFCYTLLTGGMIWYVYRYLVGRRLQTAETERLKELDAFKTRFFTNITHEFRTPLTVILGMTEQAKKHFVARAEEAHQRSMDMIRRNGQNLLLLINQILDLSKLESGKLHLNLEKADITAFTRYIVESFHSYAAGRNIQLHFLPETERLEMDFDREKIQTILANLLSNAVKFTPEGGHVYLHIGQVLENARPFCRIKVRDTGIGIPAEEIEHIFERFYQAENAVTKTGQGTGIGLALTRELVRLMGGTISVLNAGGAVFTVEIPITTEAKTVGADSPELIVPAMERKPVVAATAPLPDEHSDKPLLLIVEDNHDVRQYLRDCVAESYQVVEAFDGREGIEKAFELTPDLIVSDVMMPEKDGFELCQTLKNDERSSHIPLVLLTAKADVKSRIEGLTRGADEYVAKPFDREELLVRLRNLLENRRRLQARYASLPLPPASEDPELMLEDAFLIRIRDVVEAHLSDADFEMPQLERALRMSRSQIFRKVKALTGQSPSLFIRSIRLHRAAELLRSTKMGVAEIAYDVGFTSPAYFSTAFLEVFGKNPSDFRES